MPGLPQDLSYGFRMLRRSPAASTAAVLSLALGIGANVTIFSLANALLFRPLPVRDPDRLAVVTTSYPRDRYNPTSYPDFQDLRDHNDVFSGLAAYFPFPMGLKARDRPEVVMGQLVTSNFFDVVGVQPHLGRAFLPREDVPNGPLVAILSYRFWTTRLGADPAVLGTKVLLNSRPFEVVGIAPKGFYGLNTILIPDVWVPVNTAPQMLPFPVSLSGRSESWLLMVGRLKAGVTLPQAQSAMDALAANMADRLSPDPKNRKSFTLVEANRRRVGLQEPSDATRRAGIMLMCVAGLVLLIACFNVANLELARGSERRGEMAVRFALGASRAQVLRQLLTENLLLGMIAGAAGMLFALWGIALLLSAMPDSSIWTIEIDAAPDGRVLLFTLVSSLAAGLVAGIGPALYVARPAHLAALKERSSSVTQGRRRTALQSSLVAAQVAVSVVLLVTAGLFVRSVVNALRADPGFDLRQGLLAEIDLGFGSHGEAEGRALFDRLLERVRSLPGVERAALAVDMPLSAMHLQGRVTVDGYDPAPGERMVVHRNMVGPGYFETLGVPMVRGRAFDDRDRADSRRVVVINETMARRYWSGREALGGFVRQGDEAWEVVGVVRDGKYDSLEETAQPYACFPLAQSDYVRRLYLLVRLSGSAQPSVPMIRSEIQRFDPNLPPARILTIRQYLSNAVESAGGPGDLLSAFGLLALVLATIGLYGLVSHGVSLRTHEFGIRMAMGARQEEILRSVLRSGLRITLAGLAIGLAIAGGVAHLLRGLMFGVSPVDWITYVAVSALLLAVAAAACYLPARSAARVNPARALRYE